MVMQGKNTGNPDGLPSILTRQKQKLTFENRGLDNFCHPNISISVNFSPDSIARL